MSACRELVFVEDELDAFVQAARLMRERGIRAVTLHAPPLRARPLRDAVGRLGLDVVDSGHARGALIYGDDEAGVAASLLDQLDAPVELVVAPFTSRFFQRRPLFLISIPKAGTHLLYRLAELLGYSAGVVLHGEAQPGAWYCLEYSNSHTLPRDFFVDTVRRSPFGNRLHPFSSTPALFIYRNPLDILVSEANYYHLEGNTPFCGYLSTLSLEDRLLRLVDDPWLLGTIRDRVGGFVPWLDFPNVLPLSFEELVGPQGGGDAAMQARLIWSLQLRLQVPGRPTELAARLFDATSPTFHKGQIGCHRDVLTARVRQRFDALPQDFMRDFGYRRDDGTVVDGPPSQAAARCGRALRTTAQSFASEQVGVDFNYLGHDLVHFQGRYYALRHGAAVSDVARENEAVRATLPSAPNLFALRTLIATQEEPWAS